MNLYHGSASDDRLFQDYLEKFILETKDHAVYLERIVGAERLESLKAVPGLGYRTDLKRRS